MTTIVRRQQFILPNSNVVEIEKNFRVYLASIMANTTSVASVFATICSGLKIQEDTKIDTMCVTITNGHYLLKYSPDMVKELDVYGASIVLAHEMAHLSLGHVPRMLRVYEAFPDDVQRSKVMRVVHQAADYAVNSWLIDVLKIFSLSDLKTKIGKDGKFAGIHPSDVGLPTGKSMEFYVNELADKLPKIDPDLLQQLLKAIKESKSGAVNCKSAGDACGNSNSPSTPGSGGGSKPVTSALADAVAGNQDGESQGTLASLKDIPEEILEALNKESNNDCQAKQSVGEESVPEGSSAAEVAQELTLEAAEKLSDAINSAKARGTGVGNLESMYKELYGSPEVRWQDVLKRIFASSRPSEKDRSIARPKRKHTDLGSGFKTSEFPGKVKCPKYNIVFAIDTSGSVSDHDINKILVELQSLAKDKSVCITCVQADYSVAKVYPIDDHRDVSRTNIYGRGGTDFNDVFKLCKEGYVVSPNGEFKIDDNVDMLIYATDGECYMPRQENRIPARKVLWLSTTGTIPSEGSWGTKSSDLYGECSYGRFIVINSKS